MDFKVSKATYEQLEGLERAIRALDPALQNYVFGEMTFAASKRYVKVAKSSTSFIDRSGKLRKSIRAVRVDDENDRGRRLPKAAAVATMGGKTAPHAHLIEGGTEERVQGSTGRATGRVKPRRMLEDAFNLAGREAASDGITAAKRNFTRMVNAARGAGTLSKSQRRALGG